MDVTHSIGSVTRADDNPGVTSSASQGAAHCDAGQAAAHCDAGQAAISDSNDGLNCDDVSEHDSTSACSVSGSESQLRDVNVLGDSDTGMY